MKSTSVSEEVYEEVVKRIQRQAPEKFWGLSTVPWGARCFALVDLSAVFTLTYIPTGCIELGGVAALDLSSGTAERVMDAVLELSGPGTPVTLNCFEFLKATWEAQGFREVRKVPWCSSYAPQLWRAHYGTHPVIYMRKN